MSPDIAGMIVGVLFMLITAGTALLWPLSRRLADLVDVVIEEKRRTPPAVDDRVEQVLVRMDARLSRLEEARSFMSALDAPKREAVAAAAGGHGKRRSDAAFSTE